MLKENFISDFDKLINVAWAEDGEKKLVKILFSNKANIEKDETKGKEFITNLVKTNKALITKSCSDEFVNSINLLIGSSDNQIAENKIINNMNTLINSIQKKQNKMYKYYQVNYLNESKYVAVPLFAVNQLTEHRDVLKYALESKQLKTSKGVDYVVEVSEQEFEDVMPDTEESFGKESTEGKLQDAGIDSAKNKFDSVKQEKGAQQTKGKDLHESLTNLFEAYTGEDSYKNFNGLQGLNLGMDTSEEDDAGFFDDEADIFTDEPDVFDAKKEDDRYERDEYEAEERDEKRRAQRDYDDEEELDESEEEDFVDEDAAYFEQLYNGEKQAGLHGSKEDFLDGIDDDGQRIKTRQMMGESSKAFFTEAESNCPMCGNKTAIKRGKNACTKCDWNETIEKREGEKGRREYDKSIKEDEKYAETLGATDFTKHMTKSKALTEGVFGSEKCPKCDCETCYKIAGDYSECPECHNHWKSMNENDTADIQVPSENAFSGNKQAARKVNPFGEKSDSEYMSDEDILQEAFIKFVLRKSQGAKEFLKKGKFQLKEFLDSKSYDMLTILENEFKSSLEEADAENYLDINDVTFERGKVSIEYFYPSQEDTTNVTVDSEEFFDYLESQDPNWEDYQDSDAYWESLDYEEQIEVAKIFLVGKKGVSKIL